MNFNYELLPAIVVLAGILAAWFAIRTLRTLPARNIPAWRKISAFTILLAIALIAITAAASASFNAIALYRFQISNPPSGETFLVNGHRMHIHCTGSGSPTIVLDAGLGNDSLIWGGVQPVLAQTTRVCSYDRAGFGHSDPLPSPRDADHIANDLNGLLAAAKIEDPIVLMGHSIAGIYIREYATRYPQNVAGLIFVDASTPLQDENPALKTAAAKATPQWLATLRTKVVFSLGLSRLSGSCSRFYRGFDAHAAKLQSEDTCSPHWNAFAAELENFNRSGQETAHTGPYGDLPILIFSQDPSRDTNSNVSIAWNEMQENLKNLSTHSRRIIARGSSHYIQIDRADLIEKEVPLFIQQLRGSAPQPSNYGSTVTE